MSSDPNASAIRLYFDCFRTRDRAALEQLLAPDLRHVSPWSTYDSRDVMLDEIWPHVGQTWAVEVRVFGEGADYVAMYKHDGEGSACLAERFRFGADGKICEIRVYPEAS